MTEKTKNKSKGIIIALVVVIAILVGAGITTGFILLNNNNSTATTDEVQAAGVVFDDSASAYEETVASDSNDDSGIKVPGYADMTISSTNTYFPITLLNPEGNPCNFKFALSLKETGQQIYTTDYVKPGDAIKGVTLDSTIPKGEYTLLINISTSSLDSGAEMNGAQVQAKLTVE